MVQAQAQQLLNQKSEPEQHPLVMATERVVAALERLEQNIPQIATQTARDVRQHEQLVMFERENVSLKADRANLTTAISQLESQYSDLHKVAGTIYNKLDDSIKRLTRIIEG